jgi:hypothetical protein
LPSKAGRLSVFLNVPFDKRYEPLFVALIAGLVAIGRKPRCVLEIPDAGEGRRKRLLRLIEKCQTSIHDLCRVTGSGARRLPRFNMPFELGVTYALKAGSSHRLFLFEQKAHRVQITLSDMNGVDPQIHDGTQRGVLRCVLNCLGSTKANPELAALLSLTFKLSRIAGALKRKHHVATIFERELFRQLVAAATRLAEAAGLITVS